MLFSWEKKENESGRRGQQSVVPMKQRWGVREKVIDEVVSMSMVTPRGNGLPSQKGTKNIEGGVEISKVAWGSVAFAG